MTYKINRGKPSKLEKLRWWLLHNGPERHVTIESRNGLVTFHSRDKAVGKHIYFRREYDVDKVIEIIALLEANGYIDSESPGVALNVGANIGLITLALKLYTVFDRVIAFEPVPTNYGILQQNVRQNGFADTVDCVEMALSSIDGEIQMELSGENFGDHRIRSSDVKGHFHEENRRTLTVKTGRLDSYIEQSRYQADRLGVIWMDIQGHDASFYQGAGHVISHYRVPVVGEFWPYGIKRSGYTIAEYCDIVTSLFSHYYDPRGEARFESIDSFAEMFDKYVGPEDGSDIVLVNQNWLSASD